MGLSSENAGVSIILCCYNSAERLPETLQYLANQIVPEELKWEVVLVDNASNDNTSQIAESEWEKYGVNVPLTIVSQPTQGLSFARDKGIKTAKYEICLFCDDDNHLSQYYIRKSYELMLEKPEVAIIGGKSLPKLVFYPGSWIEDMYPAMGISVNERPDGYVDWVFGAGMVIRRSFFEVLKQKNISLNLHGRVGEKQTSGEDVEICYLASFLGGKVWFSNDLVLFHYMPSHRVRKSFFIKGNFKNVYHNIYLNTVQALMTNREMSCARLFYGLLTEKFKSTIHFLPRIFIGKHRFYSFLMFYQSVQIILWLIIKKKVFFVLYGEVYRGLYNGK